MCIFLKYSWTVLSMASRWSRWRILIIWTFVQLWCWKVWRSFWIRNVVFCINFLRKLDTSKIMLLCTYKFVVTCTWTSSSFPSFPSNVTDWICIRNLPAIIANYLMDLPLVWNTTCIWWRSLWTWNSTSIIICRLRIRTWITSCWITLTIRNCRGNDLL